MNLITTNTSATMSSREIAELTEKRHDNVTQLIRRLIADQILTPEIQELDYEHRGNTYKQFHLNKRDSLVVVARLSPEFTAAVVDRWQELEASQTPKPMTTLEMIAGMATSMVEVERNQAAQAKALANLSAEVEEIRESTTIWDQRPANAEGITALRNRINSIYGIPKWAIDEALRSAYGPRPAGSVRNTHESANGSTYVVYWISDVTRMFDRIAKEAERVTTTLVEHPMVSKRFKLL